MEITMLRQVLVVILVGGASGLLGPGDRRQVTAPVGDIIGVVSNVDFEGTQYRVKKFLGIPYAESPTGDRRFRKPIPKAHFAHPYNATDFSNSCYLVQVFPVMDDGPFTEDCLVLNVYVPETSVQKSMPVMVWIHGGGFIEGTSAVYSADTLSVFGEVIVVTINYRLAAYGFLSTGSSDAPGNYGLWDQHLAIKWVHDNIQAFGGDRDSITLFGESAGAASVVYQTLFPGNKGLFKRAIAQSGSVTNSWALVDNPELSARRFANICGCSQAGWSDKLRCLRSLSVDVLNRTLNEHNATQVWTPVVDGEFVLKHPTDMLKDSVLSQPEMEMFHSVDLMIGANSVDGAAYLSLFQTLTHAKSLEQLTIPRALYEQQLIPLAVQSVFRLKNVTGVLQGATALEYTDWSRPQDGDTRRRLLVDMTSDYAFKVPAVQAATAHCGNTNRTTFLYQFSVPSPTPFLPLPSWLDGPESANHGDEVPFLLGFDPQFNALYTAMHGKPFNITNEHMSVSKAIMSMWTNFAKSGDPNRPADVRQFIHTTWPQYDRQSQTYCEITKSMGDSSVKHGYRARSVQFWTKLMPALISASACPTVKPFLTNVPDKLIG